MAAEERDDDGPRARRLRMALCKALDAMFHDCRAERMARSCFPASAAAGPALERRLATAMARLRDDTDRRVAECAAQTGVFAKLNALDDHVRSGRADGETRPRTTVPELAAGRLAAAAVDAHVAALQRRTAQVCEQNAAAARQLRDRADDIQTRLARLAEWRRAFDEAARQAGSIDVERIKEQAGAMAQHSRP